MRCAGKVAARSINAIWTQDSTGQNNGQLAIQNVNAFNAFLRTLGQVDTDWDV